MGGFSPLFKYLSMDGGRFRLRLGRDENVIGSVEAGPRTFARV